MKLIGVDIGGSHITAAEVSYDNLELISETYQRERMDSMETASAIIEAWSEVIKRCAGQEKDLNIGIAIPGPFDYENGISLMKNQGKYDSLYGLNAKKLLADKLNIPVENIKLNNDAACFLQGEVNKAGRESNTVVGLTLGTGLGSAFIVDGKSFDADLWNTPFKEGIIEDYISSRWFVSEFKNRCGKEIKDVRELVEQYPAHSVTESLFADFSNHLSEFLTFFLQAKNAECVVIGGNIAKASPFFIHQLNHKLTEKLGSKVPIFLSVLGENAAMIGAASSFVSFKIKN